MKRILECVEAGRVFFAGRERPKNAESLPSVLQTNVVASANFESLSSAHLPRYKKIMAALPSPTWSEHPISFLAGGSRRTFSSGRTSPPVLPAAFVVPRWKARASKGLICRKPRPRRPGWKCTGVRTAGRRHASPATTTRGSCLRRGT